MNFITITGSLLKNKKNNSQIKILKKDRLYKINETKKNENQKKNIYLDKFKINPLKRK